MCFSHGYYHGPLEIPKFMFIYKPVVSQNPINNTRNKYSAAQQQTKKSRYYSICNTIIHL